MVKRVPICPIFMVFRISAYIEEEVQRRLQDLHHTMDDAGKASADMMRVS
jgi:hypothetical protein